MTRIVVAGIAGRMGQAIAGAVETHPGAKFAAGTVQPGGPAYAISSQLGVPVDDTLEEAIRRGADVVIDFTAPEATAAHAAICARHGVALVIGTTGLSAEQRQAISDASGRVPVVLSPNMSVGVNLLFRLADEAARVLGDDYDVEILEAHHRHKKDAPSGTAMRLAEVLAGALGRDLDKEAVYERRGAIGPRTQREIGIQTLRGGDVVGDHTVFFMADGERVELTHKASSRDAFATGAVRAALWVHGRGPGLYDMQDVLGFR